MTTIFLSYGKEGSLICSHTKIPRALRGKKKKPEAMNDNDWEELESRACEAIRLNLVDDIVYHLLQIKSPLELWATLEIFYMTKSSTNKRYLKKQLQSMKLADFISLKTHLNRLNKAVTVTHLLSVDFVDDDKTLVLIALVQEGFN